MVNADPTQPLLRMSNIVKHFPGAKALDGVDLEVLPGEVHCLLGQNGAGKSTLIKVLAGAHQPDSGTIIMDGSTTTIANPVAALTLGIATMYQELDVVDGLSVAENVYLGHELATAGLSQRREAIRRTKEILAQLGHPEIRATREVGTLSAAGKQIVSMARALSHNARIIVMDEPSAVLDSEEVDNLFRVVKGLQERGVAIIYISHRMDEIRRIGNRITVLKDGKTVATNLSVADTPSRELITLMTGRTVEHAIPARGTPPHTDQQPVLSVKDLGLSGVFEDVSFEVRPGEIVGLAGLVGSGRSEILETLYGARRASSGEVRVAGKRLTRGSVPSAVAAGVGLCPEERKSQGLILTEPIYRNITMASFTRIASSGFLNEKAEKAAAEAQAKALDLRPVDVNRAAGTLSGGNQQKLILARWLLHGCKVLLLDEPTRGVDVGARSEIYQLINELADAGTAVVVVSSEIPEVIGLADRVLVISDGSIVAESDASAITESDVLNLVMEGTAA
jgi:ribose transport system ATP-binding protein